jgi:hypothetical protein
MSNQKYTKEYLKGNGKEIKFSNGGSVIKVSFPESELPKLVRYTAKNGEVYLNFELSASKNPTEYSTHSLSVSRPEGQSVAAPAKTKKEDESFDW